MKNPKVSIIIPVYNGSRYLAEAIDSALCQTYKNIEIIVINDGSSDHGLTDEVARRYGRKIKYFKKKNGGVASALNLGIQKMTGEYFSWLSHDDVYFPKKVETEIKMALKSSPQTIIYSNIVFIDEYGDLIRGTNLKPLKTHDFTFALLEHNFIHGCALLIHRSAFLKVGSFDVKLKHSQDYALWFKMLKMGYRFKLCSEALVKGRLHLGQDSVKKSTQANLEKDRLFYQVLSNFSKEELFADTSRAANRYLGFANLCRMIGCPKTASLAHDLAQKNLQLKNYPLYLAQNLIYSIWTESFGQIFNLLIQRIRKLKRILRFKNSKVSVRERPKENQIRLCLIGNINSQHNQKMLAYLSQQGYELYFISTRTGSFPGVRVFQVAKKNFEPTFFWFFRLVWQTKKIVRKVKPDIVQGQSLTPAGIAVYLSGFRPYISSIWGSDVLEPYPFYINYLIKKSLQHATLTIGSSLVLKEAAVELGAAAKNFYLVHFGVDVDIFKPKNTQKLRRDLGLKNEKIIFSPRSIDYIYNTAVIVESFANISKKGHYKLALLDHIVSLPYLTKVRRLIEKYQIEDKVIFLPPVSNDKMADYYNLADVVVSIPRSDGESVSFLEAMACGRKIIVSDLPYLKSWKKTKNFYVTKIESEKLSQVLLTALNQKTSEFGPIGRANRQLVFEKANLKSCFNYLGTIYQKVLIKGKTDVRHNRII